MALLDGILPPSALTAALLLGNAVNARDGEGFTPLELLNRMNENNLRRCRESLALFLSLVFSISRASLISRNDFVNSHAR